MGNPRESDPDSGRIEQGHRVYARTKPKGRAEHLVMPVMPSACARRLNS